MSGKENHFSSLIAAERACAGRPSAVASATVCGPSRANAASSHFTIWFAFYMVFNVQWMLEDIAERRVITVGMSALVGLLPLALTSTRGWIRRLGKRWGTLHRGAYLAAALAVVHYFWLVKADTRLPFLFAAILAVLLGFRLQKRHESRPGSRRGEDGAASPRSVESARTTA